MCILYIFLAWYLYEIEFAIDLNIQYFLKILISGITTNHINGRIKDTYLYWGEWIGSPREMRFYSIYNPCKPVLFNIQTPQTCIQYMQCIYDIYTHCVHTQSHRFMRTTELVISACCMRNGLRVHRYRVFISWHPCSSVF